MVRRIIFMVLCNGGLSAAMFVGSRGTGTRTTGPVGAVSNRAYRGVRAYKARLPGRVREGQALALQDCGDVETGRSLLRSRGTGTCATGPVGAVSNRAYRGVRPIKASGPRNRYPFRASIGFPVHRAASRGRLPSHRAGAGNRQGPGQVL